MEQFLVNSSLANLTVLRDLLSTEEPVIPRASHGQAVGAGQGESANARPAPHSKISSQKSCTLHA